MPSFLRAYGDTVDASGNPQVTSTTLSLLSSIVQAGELVGSLSAAFIGGYVGRKGGLVAAVWPISTILVVWLNHWY